MTYQNDEYGEYFPLRILQKTVKGTQEHRTAQATGCADATCLLSINVKTIKEVCLELKEAAKEIGLHITTAKPKLNHVSL